MQEEAASTYEATQARQRTQSQPDKIHWDGDISFRDHPYRQLHHQKGLVGVFRIRLLEASNLCRPYWSPLALGPVRHLGLSKAHGEVSAFCTFSLGCLASRTDSVSSRIDRKPTASRSQQLRATSTVAPQTNNPVWENVQFDFPLRKGFLPEDGMRLVVDLRVDEDSTPLETLMPGTPSDGDARLIGIGQLDVTDLCLGQTCKGGVLPGVLDAWIPVKARAQDLKEIDENDPLAPVKKAPPESPPNTGMVRVLVSYRPSGLEPQEKDIVALESFARRSLTTASCRPLLPPMKPLTVVERRGAYLLCEYSISETSRKRACARLHRNAVFVIERQNLADAAHNLALLPFDVMMSTPIGRATSQALGPVGAASREILMPAALSVKLLWVAARASLLAGLSGVQALGSTLWQEGSSSLTGGHHDDGNLMNQNERYRSTRDPALSQFVQL